MRRPGLILPLLGALTLSAAAPRGTAYLYTYTDRAGATVVTSLPPAYMQGRGLVLKHVGVGRVRLAVTPVEMAKALKSPELIALVDEIATAEGVDTHLVRAVIQTESAFNYRARSRAGALGLMQLMPSTAERFGVVDPFDPRQNIQGGVKYLKWLQDYYKGDLTRVVAAYNAGEGAVNRHKGVPPYRETQAYVPKVLALYERRAVQADPKLAGSMAVLQKGRGGFKVEGEKTVPLPTEQERATSRIYQWTDAQGRLQISDQPPPEGTVGVKTYGAP